MPLPTLAPLHPSTPDYEHKEQSRFFALLSHVNHPAVQLTFAVPNQAIGLKGWGSRKRYTTEGVRRGIADILCLHPGPSAPFLAMEFKRPGGKVSPHQKEFLQRVKAAGGNAFVVYSAQQAFDTWLNHLGMKVQV